MENKNRKAKSPIRTEALVPTLLVLAGIYLYFFLFFDSHLRRTLEFVGSRVHGAEINIASFQSSFWKASLEIQGIQVTDKKQPSRNLFEIGNIRFQMLWDAILRAKVVVEESSILDIRAHTLRKSPGYVFPPSDPSESLIAKAQEQILEQTKKKFQQNVLGDLASVLDGVDPKEQLKNIQAELKSTLRAEELETELNAKKVEWQKRLQELPKPEEIKTLEAKIKTLDLKTKNPLELAKNLKQAKEIVSEAESKIRLVESAQKDFSGDISKYTNALKDLEKMAANDVLDLQKRFQIPSLDPKTLTAELFLSQIEEKLGSVRKYVLLARKVMPPKRTEEEKQAKREEQLIPRARGQGENISFPITTGYPTFWLKKAAISSEIQQSEWAGNVKGEIRNLSTAPSLLQNPMQIELFGDFPKQEIQGLRFLGEIDHRTEKPKESIQVEVLAAPVRSLPFSNSEQIQFGLKEASASGKFFAKLAEESLQITIDSKFSKPEFFLDTKNDRLKEILQSILKDIPTVTMSAKVTGTWEQFDLDLDSNLGREISAGFQKQFQAKLTEAKSKLDSFVQEKLGPAKKKVEEQFAGLSGGLGKSLNQRKSDLDFSLQSAKSSAQGSGSGNPLEEKGKSLLKGFGL